MHGELLASKASTARFRPHCGEFLGVLVALLLSAACVYAQQADSHTSPAKCNNSSANNVQTLAENASPAQCVASGATDRSNQSGTEKTKQTIPMSKQQPKRILGLMPNYRAVSAGSIPPPPTPKEAFKIATQNSFDYSAFVFVGLTSAIAEGTNAHPQLGKGVPGFGRYYWRGFVDKTDGNYLVLFALPTVFHQDERYYALGEGGFWRRFNYSVSQVVVTRNYEGRESFNFSELLGRGIAQGASAAYYPTQDRTAGTIATKYAFEVMRDALTNTFREFWPDIATRVLHRHP